MNAAQLTLDNIERFGEYASTWFEDRSYTNVQQYHYACRFAETLRQHGVQAGDGVVVMMLNSPAVTSAFVAIWKLGAVIIPVTPMWNAREVRYVLEDSGASFAITSPELAARMKEASADLPSFREVLCIGESSDATNVEPEIESAAEFAPLVERAPGDLAMLLYTSGTTGNPKGVMLSHDNMIFVADALYERNASVGQIRSLSVLPMSHVYGVLMMNLGYRMGNSSTIMKHFDAGKVLSLIESFKVQRLAFVPTMLTMLINHPDREKYDYSSLQTVGTGGAPLAESTRLEFERLFNCTVKQGYGLSETAGALTTYYPDEAYRVGSVGRAMIGFEICAMDFSNNILPAGETGELCTRGRHVMLGYLNKPEATRDTIIDGWLHTGDIGHVDTDGYVFITDRKKELVIKGGENISPREIEEGLYSHPAIAEAAVFGIPDEIFGENLAAAVVLRAGHSLTEDELKTFIGSYVTKFKVPAKIVFLDSFPKGPSGKILKRAIRDEVLSSERS
ncbi:MAG: AMP-binding protein [Acidobacteriota bacterium]|nr:AMP-binding protein [Acidobacteriota bacterium]